MFRKILTSFLGWIKIWLWRRFLLSNALDRHSCQVFDSLKCFLVHTLNLRVFWTAILKRFIIYFQYFSSQSELRCRVKFQKKILNLKNLGERFFGKFSFWLRNDYWKNKSLSKSVAVRNCQQKNKFSRTQRISTDRDQRSAICAPLFLTNCKIWV